VEYKTNDEKVEVFASMLDKTYSGIDNESDFDNLHKIKVNKFVNDYLKEVPEDFFLFSTHEIVTAIKKNQNKLIYGRRPRSQHLSKIYSI